MTEARAIGALTSELLVLACLALLPGGDAGAVAARVRGLTRPISVPREIELRFRLWQGTRHPVHLQRARQLVALVRDQAPVPDRPGLVERVPLYREVMEADEASAGRAIQR